MPKHRHYFVYILASASRTLYIGVTNNLQRRLAEHRSGTGTPSPPATASTASSTSSALDT